MSEILRVNRFPILSVKLTLAHPFRDEIGDLVRVILLQIVEAGTEVLDDNLG